MNTSHLFAVPFPASSKSIFNRTVTLKDELVKIQQKGRTRQRTYHPR